MGFGQFLLTENWFNIGKPEDDAQIQQYFHDHAQELGDLILPQINARTPERTGALASAETFEINTEENVLVYFYAETGPQEAAWGRVYDLYQEGGPLGLSTYTNAPHEMFYGVETQDTGLIESWGDMTLTNALSEMVGKWG